MDKKDRKEEEKREKKEQKEREKREKEREKERKSNRSPRPAPVISGPILPPSMMSPLPLSRSASTRGSPPSDPAPVVVGSHSKLQQLLGAEVPVPNGTTAGSISKVQHLLGEISPGATAPARPIPPALGSSIPKPLDPGGSRREVNKETVLPPPPLLKCVTFDQVMHYRGHRFVLISFSLDLLSSLRRHQRLAVSRRTFHLRLLCHRHIGQAQCRGSTSHRRQRARRGHRFRLLLSMTS